MTRAIGIDISKYDVSYSPIAAETKPDFAIQRVSYKAPGNNATVRDEAFERLFPGVLATPIRGGYHYMGSKGAWKEQADKYIEFTNGLPYHFHVCDIETAYNVMNQTFISSCMEWLEYVHKATGKPTMLYSNVSVYQDYIAKYEPYRAAKWPFWLAQYPFNPPLNVHTAQPRTPKARDNWHIWQYSPGESNNFGPLFGVGRRGVDVNVYNGTVEQMRAWLGLDAPAETKPPLTDSEKLARLWDAHPELW